MTLYRHEMKMNLKSLIIWTLCVGGMCFGCILLYTSLEDSLQEIADVYANMGAMSTALGMDKMSLATLTGFYATEIAMMHGLGGAMFAADMMCRIIPAIENVKYLDRMEKCVATRNFVIDTDTNIKHGNYRYLKKYDKTTLTVFIDPTTMQPYEPNLDFFIRKLHRKTFQKFLCHFKSFFYIK